LLTSRPIVVALASFLVIAGGALLANGCGTTNTSFFDDGGTDAAVDPDSGASDGDPNFGDTALTSDGGPNCATKCSSDQHTVIDCNNNVLQTCTGTDGCDVGTGTCANACSAAVNNKQSVGCEYYPTFLEISGGASRCFAAFVANTWNTPVKINVEYNGAVLPVANFARIPTGSGQSVTYSPYNAVTGLPAGQVAILFLGGNTGAAPSCPIASAMGTTPMITGSGMGKSFHVTTDVPVVAYEMNPYGGGSVAVTGASLLLPVSAWDNNYMASTASPNTAGNPSIDIIGSVDNTKVTLLPKVALVGGGGIPSGPANSAVSFTLNKGQFAQISQNADLVGSVIQSTSPVGVMAANPCMNMPQGVYYCDHGEQMIPPVRALGSEYVGVMYRPRANEPAIWRVIGAVDGTTLTYSTAVGGPATLNQGQVVEFNTGTPFVVKSQDDKHPFLMFEYMSGSSWSMLSDTSGYGDPDFSVQVPPQQYLSGYVIMTDPTFPETNLVIIRKKDANNTFQDVNLDCAGNLTGWQPVGDYEWTRQDLSKGNFVNVGNCSNGRHELKSNAPFGLGIWGWGTPLTTNFTANVSYSYPGGMNVTPINTVIIPPTPK